MPDCTVLLVDDEVEFVDALADRLEARGLQVVKAHTGTSALEAAEGRVFDAIVLDMAMPGMDGLETLEGLLQINPDLQVILLTGQATLEQAGNRGPLLELPVDRTNPGYTFRAAPLQQLLTAYHHRRTSGCYVSFIPEQVRGLAAISNGLPRDAALDRALELGFTTIVVHHGERLPAGQAIERRFRGALEAGTSRLEPIATSATMTAYSLRKIDR